MEQYHREHNNVFLCVALPRHVNTQSNQVDLWAYHSSTLHTLTRTHVRLHRFFIPLNLNCDCCCCTPKYTRTPSEKSNRATQIGLCVWGVISSFPTRREYKRKQLCYWNGRMQMVMVGFSVENLYGDDKFQWGFFSTLSLSLLCSTLVVISLVPGA